MVRVLAWLEYLCGWSMCVWLEYLCGWSTSLVTLTLTIHPYTNPNCHNGVTLTLTSKQGNKVFTSISC